MRILVAAFVCAASANGASAQAQAPQPIHPEALQPIHTEALQPIQADALQPIHLVILHTNDIHGQVQTRKATWLSKESPPDIGGLARLAAKVAEQRVTEPAAIVVDAGDWYQGTPEGALDRGLPFVQALALVGFDAMCVGNHEFDHGIANLARIVLGAKVPAILANVRATAEGERLPWAKPWIIVERAGVRVALVGLLTTVTPEITHVETRALAFANCAEELRRARAEIGDKADLIVPVGHISVEEARELAKFEPGLPLIVSGHSHTYLKQGLRAGETLIVQAGSKASALGRVDLWLDPGTFAVVRTEARLIDLIEEPGDPLLTLPWVAAVSRACLELISRASADLETVVGELEEPLQRAPVAGCSPPGLWIADALRERMGADIGVHNRGGTRCDLEAGPLTRRDLFELLPFDNEIVALELSGAQLESAVRRSIEGTTHTGLDFSGLKLFVRRQTDRSLRLLRIEIGSKALDPKLTYRVATNSFLANGGDGLAEFQAATTRVVDPALMREALEAHVAKSPRVRMPRNFSERFAEEGP